MLKRQVAQPALYDMEANVIIDDFRFIDNIHTTARQLPVFTEIVLLLGNKQLHKRILENQLVQWSLKEEIANEAYTYSKGKVTNENKKTIALRYHLEISKLLGLTVRYNDLYKNTKMSKVFIHLFLNEEDTAKRRMIEESFYIYQLLRRDADAIIICLDQLDSTSMMNQRELQASFKAALNSRLLAKRENASGHAKSKISEKYRAINFIWKKPEKYAEHIIAPRYEWLAYLGLVEIKREARKALYVITEKGSVFLNRLPTLSNTDQVKDISDSWIERSFFTFLSLLFEREGMNSFEDLENTDQIQQLGASMENAAEASQSSMNFKLPLLEALFFICMDFLLNKNIILNYDQVKSKLSPEFTYANKLYLIKDSGRANEAYITVTNKR